MLCEVCYEVFVEIEFKIDSCDGNVFFYESGIEMVEFVGCVWVDIGLVIGK